jgi:hypothetical protein
VYESQAQRLTSQGFHRFVQHQINNLVITLQNARYWGKLSQSETFSLCFQPLDANLTFTTALELDVYPLVKVLVQVQNGFLFPRLCSVPCGYTPIQTIFIPFCAQT